MNRYNTSSILLNLKGNGGLEKKFFFFSKARKYGEEIKIKKKMFFFFSDLIIDFFEVK